MSKRAISAAYAVAAATTTLLVGAAPAIAVDDKSNVRKGEIHTAAPTISKRLAGSDRFETSVAVSKAEYPDGASVVYVASGVSFPDALTLGPVAALQQGPLLLTHPAYVPAAVFAEIKRLRPQKIVIAGGTDTISAAVEKDLKPFATVVKRIGGSNRYATSRQLVEASFTEPVKSVYLATGADFPDALSAGAAAAHASGPLVLIDGNAPALDTATSALLRTLRPESITIAGGPAVVSDGIVRQAKTLAATVKRVSGDDRFETSAALAGAWSGTIAHAYVASGTDFPDALVGSAAAGRRGEPMYVSYLSCTPSALAGSFRTHITSTATVIGGEQSISRNVFESECSFAP